MEIYYDPTGNIVTERELTDFYYSMDEEDQAEYEDAEHFVACQLWQTGGDLQWCGESGKDLRFPIYERYYSPETESVVSIMDIYYFNKKYSPELTLSQFLNNTSLIAIEVEA